MEFYKSSHTGAQIDSILSKASALDGLKNGSEFKLLATDGTQWIVIPAGKNITLSYAGISATGGGSVPVTEVELRGNQYPGAEYTLSEGEYIITTIFSVTIWACTDIYEYIHIYSPDTNNIISEGVSTSFGIDYEGGSGNISLDTDDGDFYICCQSHGWWPESHEPIEFKAVLHITVTETEARVTKFEML